ncbi:unnamed protein product [Pylaiella littoralis]
MAPGSRRNVLRMGINMVVLGVLLFLCFFEETTSAPPKAAAAKKKKLDHLASLDPIVTLTDGNFTKYAEAQSRPYHLVVLFTAFEAKYKCVSCRIIEEPFGKVAKAYRQQFDLRETEHKVVFARIDIAEGSETFGRHGLQSAPRMFLMPQGKSFPPKEYIGDFEVTRGMSRSDGSVDDFLHDLGAITGAEVLLLPDTSGLLPGALLMGVVLGIVAQSFADVPSRALAVARHKGLWFLVSMGCYMTGVGGVIYCIIRNPNSHGFNQETGETAMFNPGGREQFWYEGAVVAILYLFMSAALLGVYLAAGWKRAPPLVRTAAVLGCVTVLCYVASEYMALYAKKTPWYALNKLVPPAMLDFHKGPLKRKHGLLKRVVRLSHLWLNEYAGFRPFCAKAKALLWDYLVRRLGSAFGGVVSG